MGGYNYEGAWVKHSTSTLCGVPSSTALYSILFFALLGTQGITRCVKCLRKNHAEMKHALRPPPWVIPAGASTWYSTQDRWGEHTKTHSSCWKLRSTWQHLTAVQCWMAERLRVRVLYCCTTVWEAWCTNVGETWLTRLVCVKSYYYSPHIVGFIRYSDLRSLLRNSDPSLNSDLFLACH